MVKSMTEFKFTFPKELRAILEKAFKIEQENFEKAKKSRKLKLLSWAHKKAMSGMDLEMFFAYKFKSDTEARVFIASTADSYVKPEALLKKVEQYSKTDPRIKISIVDDKVKSMKEAKADAK